MPERVETVTAAATGFAAGPGGFFLVLLLGLFLSVTIAANLLGSWLPPRRTRKARVPPVRFGTSLVVRPAPRHAVLLYRALVGAFLMALVALFLLVALPGARALGAPMLTRAIAFVLPILLVGLHAARRRAEALR